MIGITAPAGYITLEEIQSAIGKMESWGYKTESGIQSGKKNFTFGKTMMLQVSAYINGRVIFFPLYRYQLLFL